MNKLQALVLTTLLGFAGASVATPSLARGGIGGGVSAGAGAGGFGANTMGSTNGHFGGLSGSHISTQGSANTNGPNALDRDTGLDRAQDRMSDQGLAHNKARSDHSSDNDKDSQH